MIITDKHFTNLGGNFFNATGGAMPSFGDVSISINNLIYNILSKGINSGYTAKQMSDFVRARNMTNIGILSMNELLIVQAVASGIKSKAFLDAYNTILSDPNYNRYLSQNANLLKH